jgi:histone arginine demethylase JMJD6
MSAETEAKLNEVKLKHRSSLALEDWQRDRYFDKQDYVCDRILRGEDPNFRDTIERVHVDQVTMGEFLERYERGSKPVIITGVAERWPAMREWQLGRLLEQYGTGRFKVGESDSGRKLRVTMSEFVEYMFGNKDDSPLYLFESSLEDHDLAKNMLN